MKREKQGGGHVGRWGHPQSVVPGDGMPEREAVSGEEQRWQERLMKSFFKKKNRFTVIQYRGLSSVKSRDYALEILF